MLAIEPVVAAPPPASWQLPAAMSDTAAPVDGVYNFIFWFSAIFTIVITVVMLFFVAKYRRRPGVKPEPTGHFNRLEIIWTVTPALFIGVLFHMGFSSYIRNATAAEGAREIRVRAKKWSWNFEYPGGIDKPGELVLEQGVPYKMILSSEDVIHSFFIPEFRLKRDAVPGQYSFIQFTPTVVGPANVFCAEFCGTSHSNMLATVKVLSHVDYEKWLKDQAKACTTPEECLAEGKDLFVKNACASCHGNNGDGMMGGAKALGPKLAGLFGTMQPLVSGPDEKVDENFLRESILRPNAKIAKGYSTVQMPPFPMKDPQLDAIIAYIKSLK